MRLIASLSTAGLCLLAAVVASAASRQYQNYVLRCSGCHGVDRTGVPASGVPPLRAMSSVWPIRSIGQMVSTSGTSGDSAVTISVRKLQDILRSRGSAGARAPAPNLSQADHGSLGCVVRRVSGNSRETRAEQLRADDRAALILRLTII